MKLTFEYAKAHFENHKCGGAPYKSWQKLAEIVQTYKPKTILEIGTATGFTAQIMALALPTSQIDTLEMEKSHFELASQNLAKNTNIKIWFGDCGDLMPNIKNNSYDFIFFDGYSPQLMFLPHFERLLKTNGILMTANCHLSGPATSTKNDYIQELKNPQIWKLLDQFDDTILLQKIKSWVIDDWS